MAGSAPPDHVNPAPVNVAPLIVTGAVPEEVMVNDCVAGVLTITPPNATVVALMLNASIAAFSCRVKLVITLPVLAVIVTACAAATANTVVVNPALVAFAGTITVFCTDTAKLLLDRSTLSPPIGAGAVSVTMHASAPGPAIAALLQFNAFTVGLPPPNDPTSLPFSKTTPLQADSANRSQQDHARSKVLRQRLMRRSRKEDQARGCSDREQPFNGYEETRCPYAVSPLQLL